MVVRIESQGDKFVISDSSNNNISVKKWHTKIK